MARISTYNIDPNITADDKWIGTDFNTQYTKNFTPQYLADFFNISNSIGISGQVSFKYYSIFPGGRPDQSITTPSVNPNFSTITSLKIHKNSGSGNYCIDFINYLSGDEILISDTSNADIFGHFKLNSVTQDLSETNFYNLNVTYIGGNGNLQHLKVYSIALYSAAIINPSTPNLQQVTNVGATTTNSIIVEDNTILIKDNYNTTYFEINGYELIGKNLTTNESYFQIGYDGQMYAFNPPTVSYIQSLHFNTNGASLQDYEFPSKPAGNYILATTSDITPQVNSNWNATSGVTQILNKPTIGTWGALNYPIWTTGTPFVKMTAAGTFALDTNTYLTSAVTAVTATSPITSSGGATPNISTSMNTNKLIGRSTAGIGVMEEITIGTGLTLSGGTLNASAAGVTSVGLTMPSAFAVANSPITSSGNIAVTGAGLVSQYVRGDGTLANFPNSTGGGSSVNYYLNGSVSQGTFAGDTYYEMSKTPILGAGTNFTRTNGQGNGYIASFITDAGDPSFLNIPGGNWNLEFYFQSSATGGSPQFYGEIYKVSATNVFTLVASGVSNPEGITNGTTVDQYFTSIPVPQTSLLITDRLAIRIYVITSGKTITLHTENGNLCEVLTTFTTGLTALNGLTDQVQFFNVGTGATNFNISSSGDTHTFNLLFNIRRNANNSSNNNINYNGYAVTGSSESSAVWTITRLTIAASGSITIATATNVAWTNRESATYI